MTSKSRVSLPLICAPPAPSTKKLINDAIMNNDFLKKLDPQHLREMVDCMYERIYTDGQLVIQEGESGNYLYVLAGHIDFIIFLHSISLAVCLYSG